MTTVSEYLSAVRNVVLIIPGITNGEMWDKFCTGLKYEIYLKVIKSAVTSFQDANKIALRVDSAIWGAKSSLSKEGGTSAQAPTPMKIGIVKYKRGQSKGIARRFEEQRLLDYKRNAFFTCHKVGCRPWKHKDVAVNNFEASDGEDRKELEEHVYDSEN